MAYGTLNVDKITDSGGVSSGGLYGFKNRIINGAMMIDQRNAGASVTPTNGQFSVDRWQCAMYANSSKYTVQQNAGGVTPPVGFNSYLGVTSSSAYAIGSGDDYDLRQYIEGNNVADLAWGTANAKTVTLSFQVYSSLTGTFGGALANGAGNRSYPFSYSIPVANTWTQISITIAGDTSGTWLTTNGIGIKLFFGLGVGSTFSGAAGSWASATYVSATGATSVVGTSGATFYITGVQLEKGSTATSFDYRPYGTELALCQRYYWYIGGEQAYAPVTVAYWASTTDAYGVVTNPVTMRTAPTIAKTGNLVSFQTGTFGTFASTQITSQVAMVGWTGGSGGTQGYSTILRANNDTTMRVTFSAEL